jgi:hypothetical protein
MRKDLQLGDGSGVIFHPLLVGLIIANILVIALSVAVFYAIFHDNICGNLVSFMSKRVPYYWEATHVKIIEAGLPDDVEWLAKLE